MTIFTSPFHSIMKHRQRKRQVRTALQMLSVSGVIRPSHVEPRYYVQAAQLGAIHRQIERAAAVSQATASQTSIWQRPIKVDLASIRQWAGILRPAG
jgi:hypothetical protein